MVGAHWAPTEPQQPSMPSPSLCMLESLTSKPLSHSFECPTCPLLAPHLLLEMTFKEQLVL